MESLVSAFTVSGLDDQLIDKNGHSDGGLAKPLPGKDAATGLDNCPITDICIINQTKGEKIPRGWTCITHTVSKELADLNHNSLNSDSYYLCYRRGNDNPAVPPKAPIVNVGVWYGELFSFINKWDKFKFFPKIDKNTKKHL